MSEMGRGETDAYFLVVSFTLECIDLGEYVLHGEPSAETHRRLSPHPVHNAAQLQQEWHHHESLEQDEVDIRVLCRQKVTWKMSRAARHDQY